jgi:uncharacterized repeat protein (TIGR03803 family)
VVYELSAAGQYMVLYKFTGGADGGDPISVVLDSAGNLYGVGNFTKEVFKLDRNGHLTVLYHFTGGAEGANPGPAILDSAGNLYGTTYSDGQNGGGVLYKLIPITPSGTIITLSGGTSPTMGQPGLTIVNVTGSGFPSGAIPPANVTVTLNSGFGAAVTVTATAVTTIAGSVRRVSFKIPASMASTNPVKYEVSISGTTSTGVAFSSGLPAALTINPPATIDEGLSLQDGLPGQNVSGIIIGLYTNFVQGVTLASFGPDISVGGAPAGAAGPLIVNSSTSLTVNLGIGHLAALGPRTAIITTGIQQLSFVFTLY